MTSAPHLSSPIEEACAPHAIRHPRLFHWRRLSLSHTYEHLLILISGCLRLSNAARVTAVFAVCCIVIGGAFAIAPDALAQTLGFTSLTPSARTDIRAYYGTMLMAIGALLAGSLHRPDRVRFALLLIAAISGGSAIGRIGGMLIEQQLFSIHLCLLVVEIVAVIVCFWLYRRTADTVPDAENITAQTTQMPPEVPVRPEDFQPLSPANFREPYRYYQLLRDQYPLYKMPGQDYYLISRYEDIISLAKDTEHLSNQLVEILATGRPKPPHKKGPSVIDRLGYCGVIPVDVFALQDPPIHGEERKIGHSGFNAKFIKSLESEVEDLCADMINQHLPTGEIEFIQDFAWRLPMRLIIRLLGFPEEDFEQIKAWCVDGIRSLSGTADKADLIAIGASAAQFMRYLWRGYLQIKAQPDGSFTAQLAKLADDPNSIMTDQRAIATLFQLLIAGSDSSASSMGAALLKIAEDKALEQRLRDCPEDIPRFIEEVFRTESAFQGHFRLTKKPLTVHGVTLPAATRVFLLWASGNRDERFWDNPEAFDMDRANVKKHLTFGHGIHACLGRELARMEIRIVVRQWLEKTDSIEIAGDTPYEASVFARTLVRLPLRFRARFN